MRFKIAFLLVMVFVFLMPSSGATAYTVCSSGCDAVSLSVANGFALNGDTLSLAGDLLIENENIITKQVILEGNYHTLNLSLPMYGSGLKFTQPSVVKNLSIKMTNYLGSSIIGQNQNGVTWSNIYITYLEKTVPYVRGGGSVDYYSNFQCCQLIPTNAGIAVFSSNGFVLNNYTTDNVIIPLWVVNSQNISVYSINSTAELVPRGLGGIEVAWGAISADYITNNITIDGWHISGYTKAIRVGPFVEGSTIISRNITLKNGRSENNIYGVTGGTHNLTIQDSQFSNDIDIAIWGDNNYRLQNNTLKASVLLPGGRIFNVSTYNLPSVTILNKTYSLVNGFNISASCDSGSCTMRFYFNKTVVQNLNLNVSTLKVWHIINDTAGEWITITSKNTTEGWVEITVSSFSPYYLVAETDIPTSAAPAVGGGSGPGGYYNPEYYNPDGTRKTTPTLTPTPAPARTAVEEALVTTVAQQGVQAPILASTTAPPVTITKPVSDSTKWLWFAGFAISGTVVIAYIVLRKKQS